MRNDSSKGKWKTLTSEVIYKNSYFGLRVDKCEMFDGRVMPKYFVVDFPDWVQVVALTPDKQIILVNQYRYPGEGWFVEFPGGTTHPSRTEDPLLAAKRELREETGYISEEWSYIGFHYPNPALLNNKSHIYLAKNCIIQGEKELDQFEVLDVLTIPVRDFESKIMAPGKSHSLMLATYAMIREIVNSI